MDTDKHGWLPTIGIIIAAKERRDRKRSSGQVGRAAVSKAKTACEVSGHQVLDHFADVGKTIQIPKSAEKEIPDIMLTRYACYLIAQNGDPKKPWRRGHGGGDRVKALVGILFNCIGGDHSYVHELFHLLPVIILDRNLS